MVPHTAAGATTPGFGSRVGLSLAGGLGPSHAFSTTPGSTRTQAGAGWAVGDGRQDRELQTNLPAPRAAFGVGAGAIRRANSRLFTQWSGSGSLFTFLQFRDGDKMSRGPRGASAKRGEACVC